MKEFGVIIGCCARDFGFAKGTVGSVRHFMPEVPICLLIDGQVDASALVRAYGNIDLLPRSEVKNTFLRENSFGYGVTKMVALWESPYERFLFLDADTILWGDLRSKLDLHDNWDIHADKPRQAADDRGVNEYFFDPTWMANTYPSFPWPDYRGCYYCTGVWAARRGIFPLDEYRKILDVHQANPGRFKYGEMGFLNFMIFRAASECRIRVRQTELQAIDTDIPYEQLRERYGIDLPPDQLAGHEPIVIHYTHPKPYRSLGALSRPMTLFREQAAKRMSSRPAALRFAAMEKEDWLYYWPQFLKRQRVRVQSIKRRLGISGRAPGAA